MNSFPTFEADHVAGVGSFEWIPVSDVVSTPPVNVLEISEADIVVADGKEWLDGYSAFNSLIHNESESSSDQGSSFENVVSGFYPEASLAILQQLRSMQHGRYLLKVRDNQGILRLVGTLEDPLRFQADFTTATIGGRKGYSFRFFNRQVERCFFITQFGVIFNIDSDGHLQMIAENHPDSFAINASGHLEITGPHQDRYQIKPSGRLEFDPDL